MDGCLHFSCLSAVCGQHSDILQHHSESLSGDSVRTRRLGNKRYVPLHLRQGLFALGIAASLSGPYCNGLDAGWVTHEAE